MRTYEEAHELATKDVQRFGSLHAMDKADSLTGEVEEGYRDGIMSVFAK
jgi:hypothetical protein